MSKSKHPAIGIDLGTTFSVIAKLDDLGRPQTLINAEGDKITPSVVFFESDTSVVVGKEAAKAIATDADQVAECAKRDLGQRFFHRPLGGRRYPPEALQAWVLNKMRVDAEKQIGRVRKAVITVPAYFDEVRRKATMDAGYIAGLEVMDIINEPTAAAVAFGFQQGFMNPANKDQERRKILVYDLGGGTFDVTVMEIGGRDFTALATDGDVMLGGKDWDERIVNFVAEEFIRKFGADPREEPNSHGRLWRECEDAKRTLSARTKAVVACDYRGNAVRVELSRQQFHDMTRDLLDRTAFTTKQTLQAAGLEWKDIDRVLLVGGSSRMPAVLEMLRQLSGKEPDCSVSPDEAVAHGAALHAGLLLAFHEGKSPSFHIRNVNSHSLGVVAMDAKTRRPRNAILIPRNTPLPVMARRVFKTQKASQRSILVQIVEGESLSPDDCSQLGKCSVRDLPPDLPAQTPIEVRFRYEENGRLTVTVQVEGTGKHLQHEITRENTLTQDQLDSWRKYISGLEPAEVPEPANLSGAALQVNPDKKTIADTIAIAPEAPRRTATTSAAATPPHDSGRVTDHPPRKTADPSASASGKKRWREPVPQTPSAKGNAPTKELAVSPDLEAASAEVARAPAVPVPRRQSAAPTVATPASRETASTFKYRGEFNGRTEWGKIEATSREEALQKLSAKGIRVQSLTEASSSPRKRHMIPFWEQSETWQMAATLYQETRMRVIPGGWSKRDSYPVIDGLRAMSSDEVFALIQRITTAEASSQNIAALIREIEDELRRIADSATGERVQPP